jgi:hypothetical protein
MKASAQAADMETSEKAQQRAACRAALIAPTEKHPA